VRRGADIGYEMLVGKSEGEIPVTQLDINGGVYEIASEKCQGLDLTQSVWDRNRRLAFVNTVTNVRVS
jgi:hypothetical protein